MRYFTVISILVFSLCFFRVTNAQTNISVTVKDSLTEYPFICVKENIWILLNLIIYHQK